ncbi:response regulator transcription factor [Nocardiopsis synnemataformans]|uniref:response regulator transcription factor n=1 Tax=Nocardiopsis synnemataformans TaxID=61305 RepID=UPI003EB82079
MTTTTRCPGCSYARPRCQEWCKTCGTRLPEPLTKAIAHARALLDEANHQARLWLAQNPFATTQEKRILALVANGRKDAQIAAELGISINTVRDHIRRLIARWGCSGRPHLVSTAHRRGYLGAPERTLDPLLPPGGGP